MNLIRKIVKPLNQEDNQLYNELKELLNFSPGKINHYKKAFTHRSVQMIDRKGIAINYERLEFLGDSILGSVIASYLYKKVPTGNEGYLTQMRSKIVSREHLNELGKDLKLIRFVKSNIDQSNVGDNIHGNIFEALIGAIYLDKGYNTCHKFIFQNPPFAGPILSMISFSFNLASCFSIAHSVMPIIFDISKAVMN